MCLCHVPPPLILSLFVNIPFYTSQAIVAASILQAYQQQAQQIQAGMLGSGLPNLTSTTSRGSMQPQANIPNLNMLLAASMTQGGNTIPHQANVQNLNMSNTGPQYSSAASNSASAVPTASASNATNDPTQASAAALFSQLSNTSQAQQPPVQDYSALMNNMIQSQNLYNPVVHAPQLQQFQQNPLASAFAGLTAPIQQAQIQPQPPNHQQQQLQEQPSIQERQEDPQEERQGEGQDKKMKK